MTTTTANPPGGTLRQQASLIAKNVATNWVGLVVGTLLSLVLAPIVVNSLGTVYYGIWTLLQQFTGYLWLFDLGVRESVVKYVAQYDATSDQEALDRVVGTAVTIYTLIALGGLVASAIIALALPYIFNIPPETITIARATAFLTGATVSLSFVFNVYVGVLMGLHKLYLVTRLSIFIGIARAAVIVLLLKLGYGIIALAFVSLAMSVLNGWRVYSHCRVQAPNLSLRPIRPKRETVAQLFNYGKWVLVSNLGDKVIFSTDAMVIGALLPVSQLAYYAIAGTLITNLRSIVSAMASVVNPLSSRLQATKEMHSLTKMVQTGTKFAVLMGLPFCVGFIILGERFIALWMGPEFAGTAAPVLTALALGSIAGLPYLTISGYFYGVGDQRIVALSRIVEGAANLALSIALIKPYGLLGVAIGTTVPQALMVGGVLPWLLPARLPIRMRDYYVGTYVRPLLASVPFWVACWAVERFVGPGNLASFLVWGVATLPFYLIPAWFIALSGAEQARLQDFVRRRGRA